MITGPGPGAVVENKVGATTEVEVEFKRRDQWIRPMEDWIRDGILVENLVWAIRRCKRLLAEGKLEHQEDRSAFSRFLEFQRLAMEAGGFEEGEKEKFYTTVTRIEPGRGTDQEDDVERFEFEGEDYFYIIAPKPVRTMKYVKGHIVIWAGEDAEGMEV
jgi:hypothetical protein